MTKVKTKPDRLKKKILFEGKYLRFVSRDTWEYVERIRGTAIVVICALTPQKKVLFVDQHRTAVDKRVIEFPAGLVNDWQTHESEESLKTAAVRELYEETGYRAKKWIYLTTGPSAAGISPTPMTFFKAEGLKKEGKGGGDEYEVITIYEVPFGGVDRWLKGMQKKGFLVDPKVYIGLYFLKNAHRRYTSQAVIQ